MNIHPHKLAEAIERQQPEAGLTRYAKLSRRCDQLCYLVGYGEPSPEAERLADKYIGVLSALMSGERPTELACAAVDQFVAAEVARLRAIPVVAGVTP